MKEGITMKKQWNSVWFLFLIAGTTGLGTLRTQAADAASGATAKENTATSVTNNVDASLDALANSIRDGDAMTSLTNATKPSAEKLREIDDTIANIDKVLDRTKEDGPLAQLLNLMIKTSQQDLEKWKGKAEDPTMPEEYRCSYKEAMEDAQTGLKEVSSKLLVIGRIHRRLEGLKKDTTVSRQFFVDMVSLKRMKDADKALSRVHKAFREVLAAIAELKPVTADMVGNGNQTPAPK